MVVGAFSTIWAAFFVEGMRNNVNCSQRESLDWCKSPGALARGVNDRKLTQNFTKADSRSLSNI